MPYIFLSMYIHNHNKYYIHVILIIRRMSGMECFYLNQPSILADLGSYKKLPQTGGLANNRIYFSQFRRLEAQDLGTYRFGIW